MCEIYKYIYSYFDVHYQNARIWIVRLIGVGIAPREKRARWVHRGGGGAGDRGGEKGRQRGGERGERCGERG